MQIRQIAWVFLINSRSFHHFTHNWWFIFWANLLKKLSLSLLNQDLLHRFLWMNSSELLIVFKYFRCNFRSHTIFKRLFNFFRCHSTSIPLSFFLLSFCFLCLDLLFQRIRWNLRFIALKWLIRINTACILVLIILSSLIPLISQILFPIGILLDILYSFLDNLESLTNFKVFHVLIVV